MNEEITSNIPLPCKICNGVPKVSKFRDGCNKRVIIQCTGNDHYISTEGGNFDSAVNVWNKLNDVSTLPTWLIDRINKRRFKHESKFNNDLKSEAYIRANELLWVLIQTEEEIKWV